MKQLRLTYTQLSLLCQELALLIHAGVGLGDGLRLMAQEEADRSMQALLSGMATQAEEGASLARVLEQTGAFPVYVTGLVEVGERTGRTEQALSALASYYEQRERMQRQVRGALTYPAILLLLMLVVIVVLLSRVLPVFNDVYAALGGSLTGVAGGLLILGRALDAAMPLLCVGAAVLGVLVAAFALHDGLRARVLAFWRVRWGDRGVSRKLSDARFAQALAMGLSSGLPLEEAVELSAALLDDVPAAARRCRDCSRMLMEGEELSRAMRNTQVLPVHACRLLELGLRSGSGDQTMTDIARRLSDEAETALDSAVARVEPALVLVTSVMVGVILLSVMLPLMDIMSAIG